MLSVQDLEHPLLVRWVRVRVDEADADRVDLPVTEPPRRSHRVVVVERPDLAAVGRYPASHGLDPIGRDDAGRLHPEIAVAVAVRHRLPGDLEHVLVPLGRDEPEVLDLALQQLVRRHRRAVADRADLPTVQAEAGEHLVDARQEALGRVSWGRGRLGRGKRSGVFVHGDNVGERPAGVHTDPDAARHAGSWAGSTSLVVVVVSATTRPRDITHRGAAWLRSRSTTRSLSCTQRSAAAPG